MGFNRSKILQVSRISELIEVNNFLRGESADPIANKLRTDEARAAGYKDRHNLLMLNFPIVINPGIVVRDPALVARVVEAVGQINQNARIRSDHFVSVRHSRRNQQLPRPQRSDV